MITLLFQSSKAKREREAKSQPENAVYMQLAQLLEEQILKGRVDFSTPEPDPRREILFIPIDGSPLEIAVASSIVKELAPLVLYLRYLAEPGELLIIDEPEMNLHPEGQAKIIEFLATLVNAGLRIIFMTHSTYVVDHLINLMDATKHENKESIVTMFYLQRGDAFLAQDHVAVYLVDKGKVEGILDENGIIHWATFSDVSDRVMQLHFE
jgi:predicted ATPase